MLVVDLVPANGQTTSFTRVDFLAENPDNFLKGSLYFTLRSTLSALERGMNDDRTVLEKEVYLFVPLLHTVLVFI